MRKIKADLHNHLRSGPFDPPSFNEVLDFAYDKLGKGGLLGVVNFSNVGYVDRRYEKFVGQKNGYERQNLGSAAVYVPDKNLIIVKGQEIPVRKKGREVHLWTIGVPINRVITPGRSLEDTFSELEDTTDCCVNILEHPFSLFGLGAFLRENPSFEDYFLSRIDAIEVHNGMAFFRNSEAHKYFEEKKNKYPNLGALISSDGHSIREIGTSFTNLETVDDYTTFFNDVSFMPYLKKAIRENKSPSGRMHTSFIESAPHVFGVFLNYGFLKPLSKIIRRNFAEPKS